MNHFLRLVLWAHAHNITLLSDLFVFSPSLAWGFYNSHQRTSVASCTEPQVRNSTPLPPSPFRCADQHWAAHWSACFNTNAACFSLPVTTPGLFSIWFPLAWPHLGNPTLIWFCLALALLETKSLCNFPLYQSFCSSPSLCDLVFPSYLSCGLLVVNVRGSWWSVLLIISNDIVLTDAMCTQLPAYSVQLCSCSAADSCPVWA